MLKHKITMGGQISIPAEVRRRWGTQRVVLEDRGDHLIVRPLPNDPIAAARGALKGELPGTDELRAQARRDEVRAESRRA